MENSFTRTIQRYIEKAVTIFSFSIYLIMATVTIEVISRYLFNQPLIWVWPINRQLFALFLLIGGIFVTTEGEHIRVQVFYDKFKPGMKRFSKFLGFLLLLIFVGTLIWQTAWMGMNSLEAKEMTRGVFKFPLYPLKVLIPIAAVLFLFEGIIHFLKTWKDDEY
ncbi:MAG: TRAP transporter small permease [Proteobacteria bacterium]|nr:TRAP transporter small permease [Pseudomonadota bacterium]